MIKKHYECSDKQMIFTILQMAFDSQMINGRLEPENLENGKTAWKDRGFYDLLCLERNTTLEGSITNDEGDVLDYRIAIDKGKESWEPVDVIVASDVGLYSARFSNIEFRCIVNYLKQKHVDGRLCLAEDIYENGKEESKEEEQ